MHVGVFGQGAAWVVRFGADLPLLSKGCVHFGAGMVPLQGTAWGCRCKVPLQAAAVRVVCASRRVGACRVPLQVPLQGAVG